MKIVFKNWKFILARKIYTFYFRNFSRTFCNTQVAYLFFKIGFKTIIYDTKKNIVFRISWIPLSQMQLDYSVDCDVEFCFLKYKAHIIRFE